MYSASNKEISQTDIGWFAEDGYTKTLAIEHGFTTAEAMMEIAMEWENFTVKMKEEWTPEKLKDYMKNRRAQMIEDLRQTYLYATQKIKDLEIENRDARVKGVSFKERQEITSRMKMTLAFRDTLKDKAEEIKKTELPSYNIMDLIEADEMGVISDKGLERLLDLKYPKEYLIALTKSK